MATWDAADPRWKVQDLGEAGRNVGQWHWQERDLSGFARDRLASLFAAGTPLINNSDSGVSVACSGGVKVEGDALVNVRKGKLVPSYELSVTVPWSGTIGSDAAAVSGTLLLPYVADENHDEDPELRIVVAEGCADQAAAAARAALLGEGRKVVYAAVSKFVAELRAGGPAAGGGGGGGEGDGDGAAAGKQQAADCAAAAKPAAAAAATAAKAKVAAAAKAASSLALTQRFYARPADLYDCLTDERRVAAFTRSPATSAPTPGGTFSWFGGSVTGLFDELDAPRRLAMRWRFSSWDDGVYSKVVITLDEPTEPGATVLTLTQTGIPDADRFGNGDVKEQVERGWLGQVFGAVRQVFGYGA